MQADAHAQAVERALALEALAHLAQNRHLLVGPLDPGLTRVGQAQIRDFGASLGGGHRGPR